MIENPNFTSVEIPKEEGGEELKTVEELGREAERAELEKINKINELNKLLKIREGELEEGRKQKESFEKVKNRIQVWLEKNKTKLEKLKEKLEEPNEEISSPHLPFSPHSGKGDMTISDLKVREEGVGRRVSWSDEKVSKKTLKQERRNLRDLERDELANTKVKEWIKKNFPDGKETQSKKPEEIKLESITNITGTTTEKLFKNMEELVRAPSSSSLRSQQSEIEEVTGAGATGEMGAGVADEAGAAAGATGEMGAAAGGEVQLLRTKSSSTVSSEQSESAEEEAGEVEEVLSGSRSVTSSVSSDKELEVAGGVSTSSPAPAAGGEAGAATVPAGDEVEAEAAEEARREAEEEEAGAATVPGGLAATTAATELARLATEAELVTEKKKAEDLQNELNAERAKLTKLESALATPAPPAPPLPPPLPPVGARARGLQPQPPTPKENLQKEIQDVIKELQKEIQDEIDELKKRFALGSTPPTPTLVGVGGTGGGAGGVPPAGTAPPFLAVVANPPSQDEWQDIYQYRDNQQQHENFNSRLFYSNDANRDRTVAVNDINSLTEFGAIQATNFDLRINKLTFKPGQEVTFGLSVSSIMSSIDLPDIEARVNNKIKEKTHNTKTKIHISDKSADALKDYQELLYRQARKLLESDIIKFSSNEDTLKDQVKTFCNHIRSLRDLNSLSEKSLDVGSKFGNLIRGRHDDKELLTDELAQDEELVLNHLRAQPIIPAIPENEKLIHEMAKEMADNIVQKRLLKGDFSVEKMDTTRLGAVSQPEKQFSAIKIIRNEDPGNKKKITIDASGPFDHELRYLNISFGDGNKYYLQIQLKEGSNRQAEIDNESFKIFNGKSKGNNFNELTGEKKRLAMKELKKSYQIDVITGKEADNGNGVETKIRSTIEVKKQGGEKAIKIKTSYIKNDKKIRILGDDGLVIGKTQSSLSCLFGLCDLTLQQRSAGKFILKNAGNVSSDDKGWMWGRGGILRDRKPSHFGGDDGMGAEVILRSNNPKNLKWKVTELFNSMRGVQRNNENTATQFTQRVLDRQGNLTELKTERTNGVWANWRGSANKITTISRRLSAIQESSSGVVSNGGRG